MLESFTMLALYGLYILVMVHNEALKEQATRSLLAYPLTAKLIGSNTVLVDGPDDVFGSTPSSASRAYQTTSMTSGEPSKSVEEDSIYLATLLLITRHKRLFRSTVRFQSAARYVIVKRQHKIQRASAPPVKRSDEVNYFGPESEPLKESSGQRRRMEAYAKSATMSKSKFSIVSKDDYEFWNRPPEEGESECCSAMIGPSRSSGCGNLPLTARLTSIYQPNQQQQTTTSGWPRFPSTMCYTTPFPTAPSTRTGTSSPSSSPSPGRLSSPTSWSGWSLSSATHSAFPTRSWASPSSQPVPRCPTATRQCMRLET